MAAVEEFKKTTYDSTQTSAVEQLEKLGKIATRKAKIACIGRPDSGKSRTLNALLGKDMVNLQALIFVCGIRKTAVCHVAIC